MTFLSIDSPPQTSLLMFIASRRPKKRSHNFPTIPASMKVSVALLVVPLLHRLLALVSLRRSLLVPKRAHPSFSKQVAKHKRLLHVVLGLRLAESAVEMLLRKPPKLDS